LKNKQRLWLVDFWRLVSLGAITCFHVYSAVWWIDFPWDKLRGELIYYYQYYPRIFSFSGQSVVFLTAFLWGFLGRPLRLKRILPIFVLGAAVLVGLYTDWSTGLVSWEWDIFQYFALGTLTVMALQVCSPKVRNAFGALGFLLLLVPFWKMEFLSSLSEWWQHVLVGVCDESGRGGWPFLPWIGLLWFGLWLGEWTRLHPIPGRWERWICILVLLASLPNLGGFVTVDIGPGFYCYVMRQAPIVFWSQFIWVVASARFSAHPQLLEWSERRPWLLWPSSLYVCRYFGAAYLVGLLFLIPGMVYSDFFQRNLWLFDSYYLLMVPGIELTLRCLIGIKNLLLQRSRFR
jgi:hypothetical protein